MKKILLLAMLLSFNAFADSPYLIDGRSGKYLGNLSSNKFDRNSISNEYGRYGNKFSPDSVNNEYGRYGSRYSNSSANNPYASNPPQVRGGSIGGNNYFPRSPNY
jgi:hypothetical protein